MERGVANEYRELELHPTAAAGERKAFALDGHEWLGFDLDHTIVRYNLDVFLPHVARCILRYLVEHEGYPAELAAQPFPFDFAKKGLIIDKELGNVVKLDCQGRVIQAAHGTAWLSGDELSAVYGAEPLPGFEGISSDRYWPLNTYFDTPCAPVFAALVDAEGGIGEGQWPHKSYADLTTDIFNSVNFNYLSFDKGYYFQPFKDNPAALVAQRTDLLPWLARLRAAGFKLFLATNSMPDYAKLLLDFALGRGVWEDAFDLVLFKSRKPSFFTESAPFERVSFSTPTPAPPPPADIYSYVPATVTCTPLAPGDAVVPGSFYRLGNAADLHAALGIDDPATVVYFGDHIPYDCGAAREYSGWHTVGVVEEIDYDRAGHLDSDPSAYNAWSCFFTYDAVAETNTALLPDPASRHTYYKRWMDHACNAVIPDLSHLYNTPTDTILNTTSFFVDPSVAPLPIPGITRLNLDPSATSAPSPARHSVPEPTTS